MTTPQGKVNAPRTKPYKTAGLVLLLVSALVLWMVYMQFRGNFTTKTPLTMLSSRAGLVMDPGAKVTYNGVEIGRVGNISEVQQDGQPAAKFLPTWMPTSKPPRYSAANTFRSRRRRIPPRSGLHRSMSSMRDR
jgi:hypothetical protein